MRIIIPSRTPKMFEHCANQIYRLHYRENWDDFGIILVADNSGGDWTNIVMAPSPSMQVIHVSEPFNFARNVNLAWRECAHQDFVVIMGDDVDPVTPNMFPVMKDIMHRNLNLGLLSPGIVTPNKLAMIGDYEFWAHEYITGHYSVPFVCVMIRRAVWEGIGFLDENFTGYGYDDDDYNVRMIKAGWDVGHTCQALIRHGDGKHTLGVSFLKQYGGDVNKLEDNAKLNQRYFETKYRVTKDGDKLQFTKGELYNG